jgi:dihydroneopterin aldolase
LEGLGEANHTSSHLTSDIKLMLTVHLSNLRFFAHHGAYEGEPETGGGFEVHLQVGYEEKKIKFNDLKNVLNYEELYHIVKKRMMMPTPLLEEVAESIIRKIRHEYSFVKEVSISIFKLQAPIEHFEGKVGITLQKKFDD